MASAVAEDSVAICTVVPGEDLSAIVAAVGGRARVGNGITEKEGKPFASKAGILRHRKPDRFWVEWNVRRYQAAPGDVVVGVVVDRASEFYRVDIGAHTPATLPTLAFDGASRRNKPSLEVGDVVYCRVAAVDRHLPAQLSCQAINGPKKDWMTGEALFGQVHGGQVLRCSIGLAKRLGRVDSPLLNALGTAVPFEIAVGLNGRIWINATAPSDISLVTSAIEASELVADGAQADMVRRLLKRAKDR